MKIGIMGGTFNPIHNAHLMIAEMAREEYGLDKVIFITGGNPPHKTAGVSGVTRFMMTHMAIEDNEAFEDDRYEITKQEKSYTVYTLGYLREKYPSDKLYFIIGEDSLRDVPIWYEPQKILDMASLLVFPRNTRGTLKHEIDRINGIFNGEILPINAPIMDISSTDIRKRIGQGKTVKYMLPDRVIDYIKEHGIYADGN